MAVTKQIQQDRPGRYVDRSVEVVRGDDMREIVGVRRVCLECAD